MGCGASAPTEKKGFAFRVRLLGGLNLYNNSFGVQVPGTYTSAARFEGKSDPFCVLQCSGTNQIYESEVVLHEQNPIWNKEFYFNTSTNAPVVTITVKDKDLLSGDDIIGVAQIKLHGLVTKDKEREIWYPLEGSKSRGEIGIAVVECYRTVITAKQGIDVQPMDVLSGSSDVYMTLQVGQQAVQKTTTKKWTLNPIWNEKFTVYVPYGLKSQLSMILYDHNSTSQDNNMGWHYVYFQGKPITPGQPRELKVPITNAKGQLEFTLVDDVTLEGVTDAGPVTADIKAKFPGERPNSCIIECRVLGAFNLAAGDVNIAGDLLTIAGGELHHEFKEYAGKTDPFARVTCEGVTYDTRHINDTMEPQWNEKFRFVVNNREKCELNVEVLDHDLCVNDSVGAVKIPIRQIKPGRPQEIWSFLDKGRGEVGVEIVQHHQLRVKVVSASNLPAKDMNGMCDPFVKLSLGGINYQTNVVHNDRSPWFEEDFRFCLPTLKNISLAVSVWDNDLMILRKGMSADLIGSAEIVDVSNLVPGLPHEFILKLKIANGTKEEGEVKLSITEEVPLPDSVWAELKKGGMAAFEGAVKNLNNASKELISLISPANVEKKEEAVHEVADPKLAARPRFSKVDVEVVAVRGMRKCTEPFHIGVAVPQQGKRFKTKEYREPRGNDIGENFQFPLPSRETGSLEIKVFESTKHNYTAWTNECYARAIVPFKDLDLIRGADPDDKWIDLGGDQGKVVVRVREMLRYQIRIVGAKGINPKKDPLVQLKIDNDFWRTSFVSCNPEKDRCTGVAGAPVWNEQFTVFRKEKSVVEFRLMDVGMMGNEFMGKAEFDLANLRRGVKHTADLPISTGGTLTVELLEEEKMMLLDRIIDAAANAKRLAEALADELADAAKGAAGAAADAVGNVGKALTGALGSLF